MLVLRSFTIVQDDSDLISVAVYEKCRHLLMVKRFNYPGR